MAPVEVGRPRPERRTLRPQGGPRLRPPRPSAGAGSWACGRAPPGSLGRRQTLAPPASAVAPAARLAAPAPRSSCQLVPAGGRWPCRGPRGHVGWWLPGRHGRRGACAPGALWGPGRRQAPGHGLAGLIHRPLPSAPLALPGRLGPAPAAPHGLRAVDELGCPTEARGVRHLHAPCRQACCDLARAQRVRHRPADAQETDGGWSLRPCAADGPRRAPSQGTLRHSRRAYLQSPPGKTGDRAPIGCLGAFASRVRVSLGHLTAVDDHELSRE